MMERTKRCVECKEWASEKHNRGFFRIDNKVYCGVSCFYEKGEKDLKVQDSPQTNKGHKRQKQILKKGSKQKTRKNR